MNNKVFQIFEIISFLKRLSRLDNYSYNLKFFYVQNEERINKRQKDLIFDFTINCLFNKGDCLLELTPFILYIIYNISYIIYNK